MDIIICDDDEFFLNSLAQSIENFFKKLKIDVNIKLFSSSKELLMHKESFDFLFLDIDMPEVKGTEVAGIMKKHKNNNIIFVTSHDTLVYETVKYQPIRFLRKTRLGEELAEALETIIEIYNADIKTISFNTERGNITKLQNDILFFEVINHNIKIHTNDGIFDIYGSLNKYEKSLNDDGFVRVHRSYLVNCKYIFAVNSTEIVLDNQEKIPVSRYQVEKVNDAFHEYLRRTK